MRNQKELQREHKSHAGIRHVNPDHATLRGTQVAGATMAAIPGKATLAGSLAPLGGGMGPLAQLQRTMASAACDATNLEQANRTGDFMRASWATAALKRFISQVPSLLAMVPRGAGNEFEALVQAMVERARAALDSAPKISDAAREAADRGDYAQWNADLALWHSTRHGIQPAETERSPLGTKEHQTHRDDEDVIAARGTQGPGSELPHLATIQKSFGRHDVSAVRAHIGGDAAAASKSLGAQAFAFGNAVAFVAPPDLHTAAHEAAHVVQQRTGVQLKGGAGAANDDFERHADLVADGVVRGHSVEALLDSMSGNGARAPVVQRKSAHAAAQHSVAPHAQSPAGTASLETEIDHVEQAMQLCGQIRSLIVPAYRRAVDALDASATRELAGAVIAAIYAATSALTRANSAIKAGPHAAMVSTSNSPLMDTPEAAQQRYGRLDESAHKLQAELDDLTPYLAVQLGPQVYKGTLVLGKIEQPRLGKDPVQTLSHEAMVVVSLLDIVHQARIIAGATETECTAPSSAQQKEIAALVEPWRSRPINYAFLVQALRDIGLWESIAGARGPSGKTLTDTANKSMAQALQMGRITDVGDFDRDEAAKILTDVPNSMRWHPDFLGGPLPDRDTAARTIYQRIQSAAPDARGRIVRELRAMNKLGPLCNHLPRRDVEALHDEIKRLDAEAARMLAPFFEGKGDGESLHQRYMNKVDQRLADGHKIRAYGWFALDAIHDGLTGGFQRGYSDAYDSHEQGLTTQDEFRSEVATQVGRAGALTAATAATGGVVGAWGEGFAAGLGAGKTTAQIAGGVIGGGASGVSSQFTADVYDQAFLEKDGFSSARDYAFSGFAGTVTGLTTTGVAALGREPKPSTGKPSAPPPKESVFLKSLRKASQSYGKQYPELDNLLTRIRNAGVRNGLVLRVSGPTLWQLVASGLTNPAKLQAALARHKTVRGNRRIDVNSRTFAKVHPQSEIERFYGAVDEVSGEVQVVNKNPVSGGYIADAEAFAASPRSTDKEVRRALGIDRKKFKFYKKYHNRRDPLFEVTFKVRTELDVPLPQMAAKGVALGTIDPKTHHVPGAGRTIGGVPEGILPNGTPIEIVDIRPVGTPRASYRALPAAKYSPYSKAPASVRNLPAPLASGTASGASSASQFLSGDDEADHD